MIDYIQRQKDIIKLRNQGLTLKEIGKHFKVTRQRIEQILSGKHAPKPKAYYAICDICSRAFSSPTDTKYCPTCSKGGLHSLEGRDLVREMVRARDGHQCMKCRAPWIIGSRRFDVHHLNNLCGKKSRKYDRLSEIDGLITLCHKCHLSLHSNQMKMAAASRPNRLIGQAAAARRLKILELHLNGVTNADIAKQLKMKPQTLQSAINRIKKWQLRGVNIETYQLRKK